MRKLLAILAFAFPLALLSACDQPGDQAEAPPGEQPGEPMGQDQAGDDWGDDQAGDDWDDDQAGDDWDDDQAGGDDDFGT